MKVRKKLKKSVILYLIITTMVVLLNAVAWCSTAFCDAYIKYIFPIWVNTYGRLTGLFSFSVGEILLVLAVVCVVIFVLLLLGYGVVKVVRLVATVRPVSKSESEEVVKRSKTVRLVEGLRKFCKGYVVWFAWLVLIVSMIMTLNCTILYHASTFSQHYYGETKDNYTLEELVAVRNMVVEKCNELSKEMERDEQGTILYSGDIGEGAIKAMQKLGQTYDQLDGYYPHPKPLAASDFFSQQYIAGYYFPFSMEANYNQVMYIMNKPAAMCHELAHLRGYIYEDEANFISYLACVQSQDKFFEYAGYLSVLNYLDNDFYDAVGGNIDAYLAQPVILPQVHIDNVFLTQEAWDKVEEDAVLDTETVDRISDEFTDTVLVVNGVEDGILSYNRVVQLLLQYYEQEGLE